MHSYTIPFLLLTGWTPAAQPQDAPDFQLSVNVNLVVLHTTVRDAKDRLVPDLRQEDFDVFEDGVRQQIRLFQHEDSPVTIGLVVDHSGSMRPRLRDVIAGALAFVESSRPEDQMFVVNFNEAVSIGLPRDTPFTSAPAELARALNVPTEGKTALYDALVKAQELLGAGTHDKKALLVISDGGDNASRYSMEQVLRLAGSSNALVYTIGVFDDSDEDRNPRVLRQLARGTGGEAYFPAGSKAVVDVCLRIARDVRNQYTLGYMSNNPSTRPGYRNIRVVTRGPAAKLIVRTRTSYFAGGVPQKPANRNK